MGCGGSNNLDVFEYDKHKLHILIKGNENHSNCALCNDDIPAGFSYHCRECNYNLCIVCKKKEEERMKEEQRLLEEKKKIEEAERQKQIEQEELERKRKLEEQEELEKKKKKRSKAFEE